MQPTVAMNILAVGIGCFAKSRVSGVPCRSIRPLDLDAPEPPFSLLLLEAGGADDSQRTGQWQ